MSRAYFVLDSEKDKEETKIVMAREGDTDFHFAFSLQEDYLSAKEFCKRMNGRMNISDKDAAMIFQSVVAIN